MSSRIRATVNDQKSVRARPSTTVSTRIEKFTNVDDSELSTGSILVYNTIADNWKATTNLNQQNVDGGEF